MGIRFVSILAMPRTGTNYLCDLIGKFNEIDSLYEIYHKKAVYINNRQLTDNVIQYINQKYKLEIKDYRDPELINFISQHPQELLDIISSKSKNKYISFKIFPNHLSQDNLKEVIIKNYQHKKILIKRNLLDVYFSAKFAEMTHQWSNQETSELKLEFNANDFSKWFDFHKKYYEFIENELLLSDQEVSILEYEKIHGLENNREKFMFVFNFLKSIGLDLNDNNLSNISDDELNTKIRKKQDKRTKRLEKVSNPQVLVDTLENHKLEFLLA